MVKRSQSERPWGWGSRLTGFSSIIRRSDFTMGKKPVTCSLIRDVDYLNLVLLLN